MLLLQIQGFLLQLRFSKTSSNHSAFSGDFVLLFPKQIHLQLLSGLQRLLDETFLEDEKDL